MKSSSFKFVDNQGYSKKFLKEVSTIFFSFDNLMIYIFYLILNQSSRITSKNFNLKIFSNLKFTPRIFLKISNLNLI